MGSMVSHDKGCSWQSEMFEILLRIARNPPYFTLKRNNFSRGKIFFLFLPALQFGRWLFSFSSKYKGEKNTNDQPELSSTYFTVNVTFKISITEKCNR